MANKAAAVYVKSLELDIVIVDFFAPVNNNDVIEKLSREHEIDGVKKTVVALAWT